MRALLIDGYAPVPSAHLGTAADVRPGPGEVRIRVEAAALNPLDAKLAHGDMTGWFPLAFPYVPGTDFAGVVDALGEAVADIRLGDAVLGRSDPVAGGALAEAIIVPARCVTRRPEGLDASIAACLPTPAGIAYQALFDHLRVPEGAVLLILGAGGAVGRAAIQLAPAGVEVVACAGQPRGTDPASPARWVRPDEPDFLRVAAKADCVLDCAGGEIQHRVIAAMHPGAKLAAIVAPADEAAVVARGIDAAFLVLETRRDTLAAIADAAARGVLHPETPAVFGFEESAATYRDYVAGRTIGKLVMTTGGGR
ncbi:MULTISPECIES: NADP-dependent oxidoreductase [Methylobacterium]|uniref:Alcohol dehydrogenase zinc-binding domain protein n=1 Tax=Methylobacterium oryzae CBMB20 TaxID=693986 RepID=A0A089NK80_9HYPH|nr:MULTISPECIES: NADP-dependent oxidoreductase [Methylobacterium]AIQ88296.1 Alcohol dehydrogenase zinc-binding domain protein [Methylobacterium oryzae CBMB20]WFS08337.1 NADP-dependent oxidoreductase [Methylobacterium sp. 391_Methyba4]